jgi:hypothetical protein
MLMTLGFKLQFQTIYDECFSKLRILYLKNKIWEFSEAVQKEIDDFLVLLCQILMYNLDFVLTPLAKQADAAISWTIMMISQKISMH